jgi:hypothetical protein
MLISENTDSLSQFTALMPLIVIAAIWSAVWKLLALYRAGFNRSPGWFIALAIFNTLGILDILYLFVFGKKKN